MSLRTLAVPANLHISAIRTGDKTTVSFPNQYHFLNVIAFIIYH